MATNADDTLSAAAAAFGQLDPMPAAPSGRDDDQDEQEHEDGQEEPLDNPEPVDDDAPEDGDEPSETEQQEDEPAEPGLDPPATWDADAKKLFATLPPEAQRVIAARESDREKAFHAKAQETAAAKKQADGLVNEYSSLHRQFAEQLDQYAKAFEPQRPDWSLAATDPQAFAQQMAYYEAATAQRDDLARRSAQARQNADHIEQQQTEALNRAEVARLVEAIPEWTDTTKRGQLLSDYEATGRALGYDDELLSAARAVDIIGLKTATEWRQKAEKYDALQKAKMQPVRAAKGAAKVATPGTAQPRGAEQARGLNDAMTRLRKSGDVRDAAAAFARLR